MDCTYVAMWFMWQTAKRKSKHEDEHGKKRVYVCPRHGKRESENFEGADSANWELSRLRRVPHLFPPAHYK